LQVSGLGYEDSGVLYLLRLREASARLFLLRWFLALCELSGRAVKWVAGRPPFAGAVNPSLAASSDLRAAAVALFCAIISHRAAPVID
jgi:hypothetical protein